jgi:hypothetical protein
MDKDSTEKKLRREPRISVLDKRVGPRPSAAAAAIANFSAGVANQEAKEALVVEEFSMEFSEDGSKSNDPMDQYSGNQAFDEDIEMNEADHRNHFGGSAVLGTQLDIDLFIEAERELQRRQSLDRFIPSVQSAVTVATLSVYVIC